jgi:hypothetical protein
MSNDEYQQQNYWVSNSSVTWLQEQEKKTLLKINEDLEKWWVATSPCPTKLKLILKDDKAI